MQYEDRYLAVTAKKKQTSSASDLSRQLSLATATTISEGTPLYRSLSLGRNRRFGDNFATELQFIPLSNDTVTRRNQDIAEDVGQQPLGMLRDKLSSIQLDEATDSN
ncbi:hypothetical protein TNCV_5139171 [Trichonephila clavipes]|nr:hypothetical protein TNCV_5139171 [Trichonephila clavipes]